MIIRIYKSNKGDDGKKPVAEYAGAFCACIENSETDSTLEIFSGEKRLAVWNIAHHTTCPDTNTIYAYKEWGKSDA